MPGALMPAAYASPAAGWALCNGASKSTTDPLYAALFGVIAYTFGGSAGTFLLPNYTDRVIVGAGGAYGLGAVGGEATHQLTEVELAAHSHGGNTGAMSANASHTHGITPQAGGETPYVNPLVYVNGLASHNGMVGGGGDLSNYPASIAATNTDHTHLIASDGSNTPHNNMPHYATAYVHIKL